MPHVDIFQARRRRLAPMPNKAEFEEGWTLLETYSKIPPSEVESHLRTVREKAWAVTPYGCISHWRFLDLPLTRSRAYTSIVTRVSAGAVFLDLGCCLGQVLRRLAADGCPGTNLVGLDLHREFVELGYELFRDRHSLGARFIIGDVLDVRLAAVVGPVEVIHAASFFHLFGWHEQIAVGIRLAGLMNRRARDVVVVGRDLGSCEPVNPEMHAARGLGPYYHNPETWRRLWEIVGERTGTVWRVDADMEHLGPDTDTREMNCAINYVITRVG